MSTNSSSWETLSRYSSACEKAGRITSGAVHINDQTVDDEAVAGSAGLLLSHLLAADGLAENYAGLP